MAQSFDTVTRQLAGDPVVLAIQTAALGAGQRGLFSASETGVLGYSHWRRPSSQLTWMDRTGKSLGAAGDPGFFVNLGPPPPPVPSLFLVCATPFFRKW